MRLFAMPQTVAVLTALSAAGCASVGPARSAYPGTEARIENYMRLRQRLIDQIGPPRVTADASQIEARIEGLADRIRAARPGAQVGDLLGSGVPLIRMRLSDVLTGSHGPSLTAAICDENPLGAMAAVNLPYPAFVRARMPARVLNVLPRVPTPLRFRVVGRDLVLVDGGAELVIDVVRDALPRPCPRTKHGVTIGHPTRDAAEGEL